MVIARVMAIALLVSLSACGGFDKEKWASGKGDYSEKNPRAWMVSDAKAAGVKVGASRASIRDLLGEPDGTDPTGDVWALGFGGYSMDPQSLSIDYDKNNIANKVLVHQT
jgi:outer membrane protein assembly factor BamE (lipoprotein component of BamABCDE complex)